MEMVKICRPTQNPNRATHYSTQQISCLKTQAHTVFETFKKVDFKFDPQLSDPDWTSLIRRTIKVLQLVPREKAVQGNVKWWKQS